MIIERPHSFVHFIQLMQKLILQEQSLSEKTMAAVSEQTARSAQEFEEVCACVCSIAIVVAILICLLAQLKEQLALQKRELSEETLQLVEPITKAMNTLKEKHGAELENV